MCEICCETTLKTIEGSQGKYSTATLDNATYNIGTMCHIAQGGHTTVLSLVSLSGFTFNLAVYFANANTAKVDTRLVQGGLL
jgi:hypothetical protein